MPASLFASLNAPRLLGRLPVPLILSVIFEPYFATVAILPKNGIADDADKLAFVVSPRR